MISILGIRREASDSVNIKKRKTSSLISVILRYPAINELKTFEIVPAGEQREEQGKGKLQGVMFHFFSSQNDARTT